MNTTDNLGLRDRKRRDTRARLEAAAVSLVLRDGLEQTTVDAISELADVSPRTFFNYFESKDAAILGVRHVEVTDELVIEHLADSAGLGPVESVVRFFLSLVGSPLSHSTIQQDRMTVVRRYPQLLTSQFLQMTQMAERLNLAVQEILAQHPQFSTDARADASSNPSADTDAAGQAARAEIMFALCSSGVRVAMKEWAAGEPGADSDADTARTEIEHRAIALVREITERLT
ncbi:TetR/AcrR family transcriptional regulator [Leifsonia sp. YAF41]|uniref:TetR/AcrR family transcriptional regulator n=1 Tax=Leifsonia sp. YAF41 TaxID=3233086 RepID=UPI003F99E608